MFWCWIFSWCGLCSLLFLLKWKFLVLCCVLKLMGCFIIRLFGWVRVLLKFILDFVV